MDYGKLAYMKVEELSEAFSSFASTEDSGGSYATFYPKYSLTGGDLPLCTVKANGNVTLVIKLRVRRDRDIDHGKILIKADEHNLSSQLISGCSGEETYLIMCKAFIKDTCLIIISPSVDLHCTILSVEAAAIGGNAQLSKSGAQMRAIFNTAHALAAFSIDENIFVTRIVEGSIVSTAAVGRGHIFDLAFRGNEVLICYVDDLNNMWGLIYDGDFKEIWRLYVGVGQSNVALTAVDDIIEIAYLRDGKLYYRTCDRLFGGLSGENYIDIGLEADEIRFVHAGDKTLLAISSNGVVFLKLAAFPVTVNRVIKYTTEYVQIEE